MMLELESADDVMLLCNPSDGNRQARSGEFFFLVTHRRDLLLCDQEVHA